MNRPAELPPPGDVHLWIVDLADAAGELWQYSSAASSDEQLRARKFRDPANGARYCAAHGALRVVLAGYLNCQPRDIAIRAHDRGKPYVEHTTIEFNLSHAGTKALIAVSDRRPVGVDVERIRSVPEMAAILPMIATREERASIAPLDTSAQLSAFFRLWTRTEALCKMTGMGLSEHFEPCRETLNICKLVHVLDLEGYAGCVAAEGFDWRLVRQDRDPDLNR